MPGGGAGRSFAVSGQGRAGGARSITRPAQAFSSAGPPATVLSQPTVR